MKSTARRRFNTITARISHPDRCPPPPPHMLPFTLSFSLFLSLSRERPSTSSVRCSLSCTPVSRYCRRRDGGRGGRKEGRKGGPWRGWLCRSSRARAFISGCTGLDLGIRVARLSPRKRGRVVRWRWTRTRMERSEEGRNEGGKPWRTEEVEEGGGSALHSPES